MLPSEVLCGPDRWYAAGPGCEDQHARRADGRPARAEDPRASRWTLAGALLLACPGRDYLPALRKLQGVVGESPSRWAAAPGRTFEEVRAALERAGL